MIVPPEPTAQTSSFPLPHTEVSLYSVFTLVGTGHQAAASHDNGRGPQLGSAESHPPSRLASVPASAGVVVEASGDVRSLCSGCSCPTPAQLAKAGTTIANR